MTQMPGTPGLPLRQLVALLAETQRLAGIAGWEWQTESKTFSCTEMFHHLTGLGRPADRLSWADIARIIHPEDRRMASAALRRTLSTGAPMDLHLRLLGPCGHQRHVHGRAELLRRDGGRPATLVGTLRDETDDAVHAQELERVNAALRTLSACNRTLTTATDETALLDEMCRVIVEVGGYACAWAVLRNDGGHPRLISAAPRHQAVGLSREAVALSPEIVGLPADGEAIEILVPPPGRSFWQILARKTQTEALLILPLTDPGNGHPLGFLGIGRASALAFEEAETELLTEMAGDCGFGILTIRTRLKQHQAEARLQRSMGQTVQALAATIEKRDPYTAGHQRRVADIAVAVTRRLGIDETEARGIILAATIHDIGKVYVPSDLLTRPGRLTEDEFRLVRQHPRVGHDIVRDIELPWPVADMILQHHERLDGSGYPAGLSGDDILFGARIIGAADVLEAMASHRPYRPGLGIGRALEELKKGAGKTYDTAVVAACIAAVDAGDLALDAPA